MRGQVDQLPVGLDRRQHQELLGRAWLDLTQGPMQPQYGLVQHVAGLFPAAGDGVLALFKNRAFCGYLCFCRSRWHVEAAGGAEIASGSQDGLIVPGNERISDHFGCVSRPSDSKPVCRGAHPRPSLSVVSVMD